MHYYIDYVEVFDENEILNKKFDKLCDEFTISKDDYKNSEKLVLSAIN